METTDRVGSGEPGPFQQIHVASGAGEFACHVELAVHVDDPVSTPAWSKYCKTSFRRPEFDVDARSLTGQRPDQLARQRGRFGGPEAGQHRQTGVQIEREDVFAHFDDEALALHDPGIGACRRMLEHDDDEHLDPACRAIRPRGRQGPTQRPGYGLGRQGLE